MNTDNIIAMPTPKNILVDRYRTGRARTAHGEHEWIEGSLEMAAALAEAKSQFPSTKEFSYWISDNELDDITRDDRAALINIAAHSDLFRRVTQELQSRSWQLIWREMQIRLRIITNSENITEPVSQPAKTEIALVENHDERKRKRVFDGWPRADEVYSIYVANTRRNIAKALREMGKRSAHDFWNLILDAMDGGLLIANNCQFLHKLHLRLIVPDAPLNYASRFDLTKNADREEIRKRLLPAMFANVDAIRAKPETLPQIIKDHWHGEKVQEAVKTMASDHEQVIMFGVHLWPRVGERYGDYDYDQLRVGCWFFRDFHGWVTARVGNSPVSVAIVARQSTRWFKDYLKHAQLPNDAEIVKRKIRGVFQVVDLLATLHEKNPTGLQKFPSPPHVDGEWPQV